MYNAFLLVTVYGTQSYQPIKSSYGAHSGRRGPRRPTKTMLKTLIEDAGTNQLYA